MTRVLVSISHIVVAMAMASTALWMGLQSRVNALWETTFYGSMSEVTTSLLLGSVLIGGISIIWVTVALAYMVGKRWAAYGMLLFNSLFMLFPSPFYWAPLLFGIVVVTDLWKTRRRAPSVDG